MTTSEFQVTGMTCAHCEMAVREEVGQLVGVQQVQVDAKTGTLVVVSTQPVDVAEVVAAEALAAAQQARIVRAACKPRVVKGVCLFMLGSSVEVGIVGLPAGSRN